MKKASAPATEKKNAVRAQCACGKVEMEIDFPAFWAWHDHSKTTQRAHGSAYATYVGTWRSRFRITKGASTIARYDMKGSARSFCGRCGTPLIYERAHSPKWVNIPRALFDARSGREPRYHIALPESPEWAYRQEPLVPLKNYPGVMWNRPRSRKRAPTEDVLQSLWPQ